MGTILVILVALFGVALPVVWILSHGRHGKLPSGLIMGPLSPRYRDGATTYNQHRGARFNVEVEDPRVSHNLRSQRRHSSRRHRETRPWMR